MTGYTLFPILGVIVQVCSSVIASDTSQCFLGRWKNIQSIESIEIIWKNLIMQRIILQTTLVWCQPKTKHELVRRAENSMWIPVNYDLPADPKHPPSPQQQVWRKLAVWRGRRCSEADGRTQTWPARKPSGCFLENSRLWYLLLVNQEINIF